MSNIPLNDIITEYTSGESAQSLAVKYNTTDNTIRSRLRKAGIHVRNLSQAQSLWQKGRLKSPEHCIALSKAKLGRPSPKPIDFGKHLSKRMRGCVGPKHPCWKGGCCDIRNAIIGWSDYKEWRNSVFERDNWVCQECHVRGGNLQAHHIKRVEKILKDNNITTHIEALRCSKLWDVDNGLTLCISCHPIVEARDYEKHNSTT